tara:strand:- start:882 stop:1211 length:330 start_codon:yes stop_codon:yes gene_type:complete
MADLNVDGAGNVGTTKATTAGTLTFGAPTDTSHLKRKIESQKKQLDLQEQRIQLLERDLRLARASNSGNNLGFTKEELNFILSRVHPDKNPNSKIATSLTSKLIQRRKK